MKHLATILTLLFLLTTACMQNREIVPSADILVGVWESENIEIQNLSGDKKITAYKTYLYLGEDSTFYRNYMVGEWEINDEFLTLKMNFQSGIPDWNYEIIDFSHNSLTLQKKTTESQYCCNFPEFESDEMLVITEEYIRSTE